MVEARANCCNPDHELGLVRFKLATTVPVVGEMVSVESLLETEVTAPAGVVVAIT